MKERRGAGANRTKSTAASGIFYHDKIRTKKSNASRLTKALLETADDMQRIGVLDENS